MNDADVQVVHALNDAQTADLERLFQNEWWTTGRREADIRRMLAETDVVAALAERTSGRIVAFSRALTDRVYRAWVLDVMVDRERRGQGLGQRVVQALLDHDDLRAVEMITLSCRPELAGFYGQFGFETADGPTRFMRLDRSGRTAPWVAATEDRGS